MPVSPDEAFKAASELREAPIQKWMEVIDAYLKEHYSGGTYCTVNTLPDLKWPDALQQNAINERYREVGWAQVKFVLARHQFDTNYIELRR